MGESEGSARFMDLFSARSAKVILRSERVIFAALQQGAITSNPAQRTDVAELVDALVLGASTVRCGGSSPPVRTKVGNPAEGGMSDAWASWNMNNKWAIPRTPGQYGHDEH